MKKENSQKSVAFFENNSWYHRTKILQEDGTVKYSKKGGFDTRIAAETSYNLYEAEFKKAYRTYTMTHTINTEIMFTDYLLYWFEEVFSERVETTTRMVMAHVIYEWIIPNIENDIKLRYINVDYLDALLNRVSKVSASSGNKGRETLSIAMKEAEIAGYIQRNPMPDTKPYEREKTKIIVLTKAKTKILLRAAKDTNWYLEIQLALFCGLRKGEILGLKFSDFNFEKRTVYISRQLVANPIIKRRSGSKIDEYSLIERDPKTPNSFRTLRVPDVVMQEVIKRQQQNARDKEKLGDDYVDNDYVSCQPNGKPRGLSSMNGALTKICSRNSLPHITVHGLRHMYATILIEMNVPLVKISALLGHESIHTTFEYYCEVMDENQKILAFMNNAFVPFEKGA